MGNEVFEDLNGGHPGLSLVGYTRLPTNTHDHLIVVHTVDQVLEGVRENLCVRINLSKKAKQSIQRNKLSEPRKRTINTTSKKSGVTPISM